ncbi:N-arachidonyl glycine receptor-like [Paramacrobiotus metropolitanus]|uniref:N-arachidonyl glycine receptor-like n=1 Tax=Paramacrobiotus metropolitanus TaxID=2943436 RepID=UPI002445D579|nr:N-arachidonyl glycine receptor-like [Paramacrobiotus metropolitanus]
MAEPGSNNTTLIVFDGNLTGIQWNILAGLRLFTCTTTFSLNVAVLTVFIMTKKLHTPFNVYLINLLVADIVYVSLSSFQGVIEWLKPNWWGGFALCCVYKYGINAPAACMIWSQVLVTVNRVWAVTWPHLYRTHHTARCAVLTCTAMWMVIHAICVPYLILDSWWDLLPGSLYGCFFNSEAHLLYTQIIEISMADFPALFIIVTYPYLLWMTLNRRHRPTRPCHRRGSAPVSSGGPLDKEHRTAFLVLTLLTISVIIFLVPLPLVMMIGLANSWLAASASFRASLWLLEIQAAADTVIIFVSVKDLRDTVAQTLCCRRGRGPDRRFSRNSVGSIGLNIMFICGK